jgi:steroid delta-isomerase-like uncharacterized protein
MGSAAEEQKNKQVVRQFFEALNRQDTERIGKLVLSTNYSFHFPGMPPMGWKEDKQFIAAVNNAFPDLHNNIVDMVAEGDKVAVRFNVIATHKGEFLGIPPSGKKVSFGGTAFLTISDGKVSEEWATADMMGLMQQIGAISAPRATGGSSTTGS